MKLLAIFALVLVALMPSPAFADSDVTFLNHDGTITANMGNQLTLTGSTLAGISGLGMGYDCPPPACSGTVTLTTGHTLATGTLTTSATFGPGGSITITSTAPGAGFVFQGSFSSATWTKNGSGNTAFWVFSGTIENGILNLNNGMTFSDINGATINLTTLGGPKVVGGFNTWEDSGGSTTFPSPIPEPGTLVLLGSGLISIGMFAKNRIARTHQQRSAISSE